MCRLKAGNHFAFAVDKKLGEVPLDVAALTSTRALLIEHLLQDRSQLIFCIEALKALL